MEIGRTLTGQKIPSNQLLTNFFSKMLLSRNFCLKRVTVNSRNFHTVYTLMLQIVELIWIQHIMYILPPKWRSFLATKLVTSALVCSISESE